VAPAGPGRRGKIIFKNDDRWGENPNAVVNIIANISGKIATEALLYAASFFFSLR